MPLIILKSPQKRAFFMALQTFLPPLAFGQVHDNVAVNQQIVVIFILIAWKGEIAVLVTHNTGWEDCQLLVM